MSSVERKPNVSEDIVKECILKRKKELFLENGQLKSKNDKIWETISNELNKKLSVKTIYSKLCDTNLRNSVNLPKKKRRENSNFDEQNFSSTSDNEISISEDEDFKKIIIFVNKEEFEAPFITNYFKRKENNKSKQHYRTVLKLEPGKWEHWFSEKFYSATKKRGFNFSGHYLTLDRSYGKMEGMKKIYILYL